MVGLQKHRMQKYMLGAVQGSFGVLGLAGFVMFFQDQQIFNAFGDLGLWAARAGCIFIAAIGFRGAWSSVKLGTFPTKRKKFIEAAHHYSQQGATQLAANYLAAALGQAPSTYEFFHKPPGGTQGEEFHSQAQSALTVWRGAVKSTPGTGDVIRVLLFLDFGLHYLVNCDDVDRQYHPNLGSPITELAVDGPVFEELAGLFGPMLSPNGQKVLKELVKDRAPRVARAAG